MSGKWLPFGVAAAVILLAITLRWLLPSHQGLTLYFGQSTRFVPANVVGFWVGMALAAVFLGVGVTSWVRRLR